ncbi:MAG: DUF3540 domain-containing protein [Deltaproteobacteria bacterium]|nr:DUF3540 domain-containing protein [Deltaproteobacteria bacterium]
MEQSARNMESEKFDLFDGRVKIKDDNFFWVETSRGLHKAKKSVSCLLEPRISDEVLLLSHRNGKSYILSVLEREQDVQSDILFEGDVSVTVKNGDLGFTARKLDLKGHDIVLDSKKLDLRSESGKASISDFTFLGRVFHGDIDAVKIVSKTVTSITGRLIQKARESYRWIENLEQIKVGRLRCIARESLYMKGKRSSLMAETKVKIDGEKIHLG